METLTLNLTPKSAELYESLKRQLNRNNKIDMDREERIRNCEIESSDCFVSTWASNLTDRLIQAKLEILENGGVSEFKALLTLDGEDTGAKLISTRYGLAWRLPNGTFVGHAKREATYNKKGFKTGYVKKPAWAEISGSGTGLAGAMSCYIRVFPSKKNYAELN